LANDINQQFVGYEVKRSDSSTLGQFPNQSRAGHGGASVRARAIQSFRGRRGMVNRWVDHESASTAKPWEALGISERTYYRQKRAAKGDRPTRQAATGAKPSESMGISHATYYRRKKAGKI
jgi:hypothetical protein